MSKSEVYFADFYAKDKKNNTSANIKKLFDKAGFKDIISEDDQVAVKVHFGEKGNVTFINPVNIRQIIDKIKECQGKPFLTDTNTLYSGSRTNCVDHIQTAIENGFAYSVVDAPIIIADGMYSRNSENVDINLKHFDSVKIGGEIFNSDSMIVISHFKGHGTAGFGGVIKNLAMGCATAPGKQMQHSDLNPVVNEKFCIGCRRCVPTCRVKAINMIEKKANINDNICYGCGECIITCPTDAINAQWETDNNVFLEKMAEYALGSVKNKKDKVGYISFVMDITPLCDCAGWSGAPIASDIGILASKDPVALEQACLDMIVKNTGYNPFEKQYPDVKSYRIIEYGEEIGLGTRKYNLIKI